MRIWPENWEAWQVVEALSTSWLLDANGVPLAVPASDIEAAMRMLSVKDPRDCLARVLIVLSEALRIWRGG